MTSSPPNSSQPEFKRARYRRPLSRFHGARDEDFDDGFTDEVFGYDAEDYAADYPVAAADLDDSDTADDDEELLPGRHWTAQRMLLVIIAIILILSLIIYSFPGLFQPTPMPLPEPPAPGSLI